MKKNQKQINSITNKIEFILFKDSSLGGEELSSLLFEYIREVENFTNLARTLPFAIPIDHPMQKIEDLISERVSVEYNNDIISVSMPCLLPKKEKGNPIYIRAILNSAISKYQSANNIPLIDEPVVLVVNHNYSRLRTEREYRDHDNIEINAVVDVMALYFLVDDGPMICSHFYTSSISEEDATVIHLVPARIFGEWISTNQ